MSKKLIEQLHPVGFATQAKRIEELEREVERKMSAADFILKERDALLADNARLREAMKEIRDDFDCDNDADKEAAWRLAATMVAAKIGGYTDDI